MRMQPGCYGITGFKKMKKKRNAFIIIIVAFSAASLWNCILIGAGSEYGKQSVKRSDVFVSSMTGNDTNTAMHIMQAHAVDQAARLSNMSLENKYFEYRGVIHVHTLYSDGGGSYGDIAAAAQSLDVDFLITTDHNTVKPLKEGQGGYYGDVMIIPGVEHSVDHGAGHYLAIGENITKVRSKKISSDIVYQENVEKGNMIFLAHIYHPTHNSWQNWNIDSFTGFELFNLDENWRNKLTIWGINRILADAVLYPYDDNVLTSLISFPEKQMKKFDELTQIRNVIGIGSVDAHSKKLISGHNVPGVPSYESMFKLVQTVILTKEPFNGDYNHDKKIVMEALRKGHCYVGFPGFGPVRGFFFSAVEGLPRKVCGDSLYLVESAEMDISLPVKKDVIVQVVKDGEVIHEYENKREIHFVVNEPGVYRVQAMKNIALLPYFNKQRFPWILSNPIYVSGKKPYEILLSSEENN